MQSLRPVLALLALACLASPTWSAAPGAAALGPALQNPGHQQKPDCYKESILDIREDVAEAT
ncbi:MAG: thioredoxin, partial [Anaerolineae bacterium]